MSVLTDWALQWVRQPFNTHVSEILHSFLLPIYIPFRTFLCSIGLHWLVISIGAHVFRKCTPIDFCVCCFLTENWIHFPIKKTTGQQGPKFQPRRVREINEKLAKLLHKKSEPYSIFRILSWLSGLILVQSSITNPPFPELLLCY